MSLPTPRRPSALRPDALSNFIMSDSSTAVRPPALPSGPFVLKPAFLAQERFAQRCLFIVGLALLLGACIDAGSSYLDLRADQEIAAQADTTVPGEVEGSVRSSGIFMIHRHDLRVRFTASDGDLYVGRAEYSTFFSKGDTSAPPQVRYRRDHPQAFVLNWALDAAPWRWVYLLVSLFLIGLLAGGGMMAYGVRLRRRIQAQLASLGQARLEWARVLGIAPIQREQRCRFVLAGESESEARAHAHDFKPGAAPLFDPSGQHVLVLIAPTLRMPPLVPWRSGWPLDLSPTQQATWSALAKAD